MSKKYNKANWFNIVFISFNTLVTIIAGPWYLYHYGLSPFLIGLTVFYIFATGLGITMGYHRLFTHVTYKANQFVRFVLLFFGAAAFEQSALAWSSQHRTHHQFVEMEADPYNIKKGFFWAHMGWLIFGKHDFYYDNVEDLIRDKLVMHQAKFYILWCVVAGVVVPVLLGAFAGQALGAFIFAVCFRITFVYHSTWCINSVCHTYGKKTYDPKVTATDNWLVAILTMGEGYHNFHHRFPSDYRNGVRWYHFDLSKWLIFLLEKIHFVWDVKRIDAKRIRDTRLAAAQETKESSILSV